jgi:hypothetical protein
MNIDINIGIHSGAIVAALIVLAGVQLGLDIVTVSPGSVSRRGKGVWGKAGGFISEARVGR